ncbi:hypothetical protein BT96DRAFT_946375 [Gymnopus androsaceus JB14]|uniref:Glycosyl transferase CAP10 domain-containing protein n=1 Tax=Gymnopus androsaceus JB14 TaxID=1447944 RepID=A0A6A4GYJ4_9AGAR|nr:hypothetical protein BT96DRAFT_946375 [Gymnopus androsaceus JB14]
MFEIPTRSRRYLRLLLLGAVLWMAFAKLPSFFLRLSFSMSAVEEIKEDEIDFGVREKIMPLERDAFEGYRPPRKAKGRHTFRPDGLVEVNPQGIHPIFELIDRAEKAWKEKQRKASASLDEAVAEYTRRYRRSPPKGFDKWWDYVQAHDVQLPDEYDQIYHDLEPFWGMEPTELIALQAEREFKQDSYTIGKNAEGKLDILRTSFQDGRYDQLIGHGKMMIEYLKNIEDVLPSFRATFSPHDGPNLMTDYVVKSTLLEAAATNSYIGKKDLPPIHRLGWRSACHPESPARLIDFNLDGPQPPKPKKTFIHSHRQSMDPCQHPALFWQHGQFLSHHNGPDPYPTMIPEFSSCTTSLHHNIRIPTPYGWIEDILPRSNDPDFDEKVDDRLLWRGSNTGIHHSPTSRWQDAHRDKLVRYVSELNGTIDYLVPPKPGYEDQPLGPSQTARKSRINPAMMDMGFTGKPSQCHEQTCKLMEQIYDYKKRQSIKDAGSYKYVFDIDGNGWSWSFQAFDHLETHRVAPWVHYIPVQVDLSDLYDSLIFFRGDANGDGAHEELARQIALQGRAWSKTFWRKEDIIAYFYRLLLEYARLMSLDREEMTFQGNGELELEKWFDKEEVIMDALLH